MSPETMWKTVISASLKHYVFTNKTKHKIQYPDLDSVILPVPYSTEIPVPVSVKFKDCGDLNSSVASKADGETHPDFLDISEINTCSSTSTVPQLLHQSELNDLVHDLTLSIISAKLLASTLNENSIFFVPAQISKAIMKKKRKHVNTSVKKKALSSVITLKDFCYTLV